MFESKFEVERAWSGGPLRKVGSGEGVPSKYVCDVCRRSSVGVYRLKHDLLKQEWACYGCFKKAGSPQPDFEGDSQGHCIQYMNGGAMA